MPAAIVSGKAPVLYRSRHGFIQNAFQITAKSGIVIVAVVTCYCPFLEEIGRRHLFGVSDNDGSFPPSDCSDGVPHRYLRGLVKND